jgi:hypothetical protein
MLYKSHWSAYSLSLSLSLAYARTHTTSSSQQSGVTTAIVLSYKTITQHLPPFDATANVELSSLTNLSFSWGVLLMLVKMIQIRLLAVSYVWAV